MPKQRILNCPLKFTSKTLEADGFVKKETCLCDEEGCAWWWPTTNMCAVNNLIEVMNKLELTAGLQLKALLPDFQSRTTVIDVER
jgi:hypothetical protein